MVQLPRIGDIWGILTCQASFAQEEKPIFQEIASQKA
jgi:hypothetical protein